MIDRSDLFVEVAQARHMHIFVPTVVNGVNTYPGNTHVNCAALLYDFCEEAKKRFPTDKWGLLTKDPGENGYTWPDSGIRTSHDTVALPNGERQDAIGAAGDPKFKPTINKPWTTGTPPSEWRPNNVWIEHTKVKEKVIVVPPTPPVIPYDENKSIEFGLACNDVYKESGAPFDPGMVSVHSSRAAYDYYVGGLDWPTSKKKHINEFRAVYGLPPI